MLYDPYNVFWMPNTTKSWLIVGPSRVGKSSLAHNIARDIIANNRGFAVLDPHGKLIDDLSYCIPKEWMKDSESRVIWYEPESVALNLCEYAPNQPLKVEHTVDAFASIFNLPPESTPVRVLRHALTVHAYIPDSHIGDVLRMFQDDSYRERIVRKCPDEMTRDFWDYEFTKWHDTPRLLEDFTGPIKTAIELLLGHPTGKKDALSAQEYRGHGNGDGQAADTVCTNFTREVW